MIKEINISSIKYMALTFLKNSIENSEKTFIKQFGNL